MSGLDREIFNNLERALSTDINDLESLKDRAILNAQGGYAEFARVIPGGNTIQNKRFALGLNVVPSGNDVQIGVGAVLQRSTTLAPVPGVLDSPWRLGFQKTASIFTMPAPGAETWYLLEAQMVEVVTSNQLRDIFNPGTQTFTPTLVPKQAERQIAFQLLTGTTQAPAPSGGDWVPLAVIRRPGGGGAVAASDIADVRPRPYAFAVSGYEDLPFDRKLKQHLLDTVHVPNGAASFAIRLGVEGEINGERCYVSNSFSGAFDPTGARYIEPGTIIAGNTWYYLYLFAWTADTAPVAGLPFRQSSNELSRGILVLSPTPPDTGGTVNLPAPWNGLALPLASSKWLLVGCLRTNAAGTGFGAQKTVNGMQLIERNEQPATIYSPPAASQAIDLRTFGPRGVESVTLYNSSTGGTATNTIAFAEDNSIAGNWDVYVVDAAVAAATDSSISLRPQSYFLRISGAVPTALSVSIKAYKLKGIQP